jgi:hypothetical protein
MVPMAAAGSRIVNSPARTTVPAGSGAALYRPLTVLREARPMSAERDTQAPQPPAEKPDEGRREALRSMARFGAYVAPAMTVLISSAEAFHATPGHCNANPTIKGCSTL